MLEDEEVEVQRKNRCPKILGNTIAPWVVLQEKASLEAIVEANIHVGLGSQAWEEGALIPSPPGRSRGAGDWCGGTEASGVPM